MIAIFNPYQISLVPLVLFATRTEKKGNGSIRAA
jgi:hypothetical protein